MITQHVLEIRRLNSSKMEAAEKTTNDDRVDVDALVNRSVLFFVQFFLSLVCIRYHLLLSNLNICALCNVVFQMLAPSRCSNVNIWFALLGGSMGLSTIRWYNENKMQQTIEILQLWLLSQLFVVLQPLQPLRCCWYTFSCNLVALRLTGTSLHKILF